MKADEFITELDINPGTAFSKGFNRGSEVVNTVLSPSTWGDKIAGTDSGSAKPKDKMAGNSQLKIEKYQLKDAQAIMDAVIKGNVSTLSRQQLDTAKILLARLNNL